MYTVDTRDRVHELTDIPCPSESSHPLVLADEDTVVVAYMSAIDLNGQTDDPGSRAAQSQATLVRFQQCYASHFGPPNDQAYATHPISDRGVSPYGAFEVENSTWLRGLEARNRGHPRHDAQVFDRLRHWVWTFHDSVLECAALGYVAEEAEGSPIDLLPRMRALLRSP